ncbi:MAG: pyridoxamine 5'-phosphate oxidase family protein [Acidimicrobiia bacterium]|jgi:nitroimidazol reductase NimA-like FMN-containing flavoprotein (pyridoxamine 5'-phosphate oxidase superfamily)
MARRDTSMTASEVAETLAEARNLQVATLDLDGWPHLTTLWFTVLDGLVTFRSFRKSRRIGNLERDPRITVLAELGHGYDELRGVMIQGRARLVSDEDVVLDVYAAVLARMQGVPADRATAEALFGRFAGKNTVVQVEPVRIVSWDHRKLGGAY